jgi:hypothetical protein
MIAPNEGVFIAKVGDKMRCCGCDKKFVVENEFSYEIRFKNFVLCAKCEDLRSLCGSEFYDSTIQHIMEYTSDGIMKHGGDEDIRFSEIGRKQQEMVVINLILSGGIAISTAPESNTVH